MATFIEWSGNYALERLASLIAERDHPSGT
jgi:hypothetical protein